MREYWHSIIRLSLSQQDDLEVVSERRSINRLKQIRGKDKSKWFLGSELGADAG